MGFRFWFFFSLSLLFLALTKHTFLFLRPSCFIVASSSWTKSYIAKYLAKGTFCWDTLTFPMKNVLGSTLLNTEERNWFTRCSYQININVNTDIRYLYNVFHYDKTLLIKKKKADLNNSIQNRGLSKQPVYTAKYDHSILHVNQLQSHLHSITI